MESRPCSVASADAVVRVPPLSGEMMESFADLLAIEKGRGFQVSRAVSPSGAVDQPTHTALAEHEGIVRSSTR